MKKIYNTLLPSLFAALAAVTLSACDFDDPDEPGKDFSKTDLEFNCYLSGNYDDEYPDGPWDWRMYEYYSDGTLKTELEADFDPLDNAIFVDVPGEADYSDKTHKTKVIGILRIRYRLIPLPDAVGNVFETNGGYTYYYGHDPATSEFLIFDQSEYGGPDGSTLRRVKYEKHGADNLTFGGITYSRRRFSFG